MIDVRDIVKHYDRGLVRALDGVSFSVAGGEFVALMGPSGCGKSTLFNLIGALDRPTSGEIRVEGRPVASIAPLHRFRAETIGFVFQFHHLIPALTLLENVELPMYALPVGSRRRRERAGAILAAMGLAHRAAFLPTRVSGGERQRAAVARALVNEPRVLLADEPTGSVDSETGHRILALLVGRCRENGTTLLLATHNPEIAAAADRIVRLKNGRLQ
jgi:ABC-type lipoprotein export system ATPase subunit